MKFWLLCALMVTATAAALRLEWHDHRSYERDAFFRVATTTNLAAPWEFCGVATNDPATSRFSFPVESNVDVRFFRVSRHTPWMP